MIYCFFPLVFFYYFYFLLIKFDEKLASNIASVIGN